MVDRKKTLLDAMESLSINPDAKIRKEIAEYIPSQDILKKMMYDKSPEVRSVVASRLVSLEDLMVMIKDKHWLVRESALQSITHMAKRVFY
jgi:hypothetical protein